MSLLETILKAQNGGVVSEVAAKLNLDEAQAGAAIAKLLPVLKQGIKNNVQQPGGLESLLGALKGGNHARYVEQPQRITDAGAISDGNSILGHLLGSKDVSRKVAADVAQGTGIDTTKVKQMLPLVAAMLMGSLSKESQGGALAGLLGGAGKQSAGASLLAGFLDQDDKGSAVGNLLGMARKFF